MSAYPPAPDPVGLLSRDWIRRGVLAGFGPRHLAVGLLVPMLVRLVSFTAFYDGRGSLASALAFESKWLLVITLTGVVTVLCAVATENLLGRRLPLAVLRHALAIGMAAVAGTAISLLTNPWVATSEKRWATTFDLLGAGYPHYVAFLFSHTLLLAFVIVALCAALEASHRADAALHAARRSALRVRQEMIEGELQAMQARVDPDLLFDALRQIDEGYATDVADGQRQLDALIRFLRAALPGNAGIQSSVGHEVELVEAYLALAAPELALDLQVESSLRNEPLPAMLLLPLVRWTTQGRPRDLRMQLTRSATKVRVLIACTGPAAHPQDSALDAVRDRLARLYAEQAQLNARAEGMRREVDLELPRAIVPDLRHAA